MAVLQTPSAAFDEWLPELTRQLAESADAHDRSGDFPHANLALLRTTDCSPWPCRLRSAVPAPASASCAG